MTDIEAAQSVPEQPGPGQSHPDQSHAEQPSPMRVLIDTSVLAPEPLWLWILALADGIPADQRPRLFVTPGVMGELWPALRRVDPRLTRAQTHTAARLRADSLTLVEPTAPPPQPRAHVLDPDDAHLDDAALALGVDMLVTDDVHAFAPVPRTTRGYALLTADEFLCMLADSFHLSIPEALARYLDRLTWVNETVGIECAPGSASHRLRRSRARRFAKIVVRNTRGYPIG